MINITQMLDKCFNEKEWLAERYDTKRGDIKLQFVIKAMIPFIGQMVLFHGVPVKLSWDHIHSYLQSLKPYGDQLSSDLSKNILAVFQRLSTVRKSAADSLLIFEFTDQQTAHAFYECTSTILPFRNAEYPKINNHEMILTDDQYYYCEFYAMQRSGVISPKMLGDHYFLKTLRADTLDYSYAFILGIMPGNPVTKRQNLRYVNRQNYTITPQGHATSRINKRSMYTPEQKKEFSQIQSCTFIDKKILSPAFGFSKERNRKLYGLMTHWNDARVNRMLVNDSGTVGHVFDAFDITQAKYNTFNRENSKNKECYSPDELDAFKAHNLKSRPHNGRTNECLARLRFNPYRSVVSICSDTLESRLLAYDFAQELLEHYAEYAKKNGFELYSNFRIPIIFYLRKSSAMFGLSVDEEFTVGCTEHDLGSYSEAMHKKDQAEASAIYGNKVLRQLRFLDHDYEFLLGLRTITPDMLLEEVVQGIPLAYTMIKNGYVRMLLRLLRRSHILRAVVVQGLVDSGCISQNDSIISQLIMAEAFDIAEILLFATNSNKYELRHNGNLLADHLINFGNPRQLNYMGFEKILIMAAEKMAWVTITLCVKEYPKMDKELLGKLLCHACRRVTAHRKYKEVELLLKMGADRTQEVSGLRAIVHAVQDEDWKMVVIFTQFPSDENDLAAYGYALLKALQHKQRGIAKLLLAAGAKPTWRRFMPGHELESTLYYAVEDGFDELLPKLIEHENLSKDALAISRRWLGLDFAYAKQCDSAIAVLKAIRSNDDDFMFCKISVCKLVVEALAMSNRDIAAHQVLKYLQQPDLISGFRIIQDNLLWAISFLPMHYKEMVLSNICEIIFENNESMLLIKLIDFFRSEDNYQNNIDRIFYTAILKNISIDNFNFLQNLVKDVVRTPEQHRVWQGTLNDALYQSVRRRADDQTDLLLKLGARADCYSDSSSSVVELMANYDDEHRLRHLLENYSLSVSDPIVTGWLLTCAIESKKMMWLAPMLIEKYGECVTPKHIERSIEMSRVDLLLLLLDAFDISKYSKSSYHYAFYQAWVCGCQFNKGVREKLTNKLGGAFIMDLALIYLLERYKLSLSDWEKHCQKFRNFDKILPTKNLIKIGVRSSKVASSALHEKILRILNDYSAVNDRFPTNEEIVSTFRAILTQFEQSAAKTTFGLFGMKFFGDGFEREMYMYLKDVDSLIVGNQQLAAPVSIFEDAPQLSE